jgi:hypothetical protein
MKNYEYQELVEMVTEVFDDFRKAATKIGEKTIHAMARFFDNYDCVINEGACEAAIVCSTLCIQLSEIRENTIYKNHYEKLLNILKQYDSTKMIDSISENEIELLNKQVAKAIQILGEMKIMD